MALYLIHESDMDAMVGLVEAALESLAAGRKIAVQTTRGRSLAEFLTSETTITPSVLIAYLGFGYPEGMENGPGARLRSYSVFVNLGTPGANKGKPGAKTLDAETVADAIEAQLYGTEGRGSYALAATGQERTIRVAGGRDLFLAYGFDVFELTVNIQ